MAMLIYKAFVVVFGAFLAWSTRYTWVYKYIQLANCPVPKQERAKQRHKYEQDHPLKSCGGRAKGPVTQAPITRTKTRTIKMHAFDWLNKRGRVLRGAFQPIEGVHFIVLVIVTGACVTGP